MSELIKGQSQYQLNRLPPERLNIIANGNNPPSIVAGTVIYFNTTILQSVVFTESVNRTFAWNTGNFPAIANSTIYYVWVDATGAYGATASGSITVSFDDNLDGWYDSTKTKKILCRLFSDASSVISAESIVILDKRLVGFGFGTVTGVTSITISGLNILRDHRQYLVLVTPDVSAGITNVGMYFNSDNTAVRYYQCYNVNTNGGSSTLAGSNTYTGWVASGTVTHCGSTIRLVYGNNQIFGTCQTSFRNGTTTIYNQSGSILYQYNTANIVGNLTDITLTTDTANGFKVNSLICVYRI